MQQKELWQNWKNGFKIVTSYKLLVTSYKLQVTSEKYISLRVVKDARGDFLY